MKQVWIFLCIVCSVLTLQAQNLVNNPSFADDFRGYWKNKHSKYTVQNGILCVTGSPEAGEQENNRLLMTGLLLGKPSDYSGNTCTLRFSARTEKISGTFSIAVREAAGTNYAKLHRIQLKKWDSNTDWKTYTLTFTCKGDVREMRLNFLAQGLAADDLIQIRDLSVTCSRTQGIH